MALERTAGGYAFIINGKVDGNARGDAPTVVMSGLLPAMLHPRAERSLVIGLGAGSTAGWLDAVPTMQRTDVIELEPLILQVARDCAPVNRDVLTRPRVRRRAPARGFRSHEPLEIQVEGPQSSPDAAGTPTGAAVESTSFPVTQ